MPHVVRLTFVRDCSGLFRDGVFKITEERVMFISRHIQPSVDLLDIAIGYCLYKFTTNTFRKPRYAMYYLALILL